MKINNDTCERIEENEILNIKISATVVEEINYLE